MKTIRYSLIGFLIVFSCLTINAQKYKVRIGCLGNSITAGANLTNPATESYPAQLQGMLDNVFGDTCDIENFAVSGCTMLKKGDFPIWATKQFNMALDYFPHIFLISLGTNDSKPQNWDSYADEFIDDYLSMIDTIKYYNPFAKFIVCLPPPAYEFLYDIRDSVISNYVIPAIDSVAELTGAIVVDFNTPLADSSNLFPDGIHPGVQGSKVLAEIVFDKIMEADLIHQVEPNIAFVKSFKSDRYYITTEDTATLSWTTICANSATLNDAPVAINGNAKVSPNVNTLYEFYAVGDNFNDSAVIDIQLYVPVLNSLKLNVVSQSVNGGDSVLIWVDYLDQHGFVMKNASYTVDWSFTEGIGTLITKSGKEVIFVPQTLGEYVIQAEAEGKTATIRIYVQTNASPVKSVNSDKQFLAFPNPASHKINFQLKSSANAKVDIKILDISGKIVSHKSISAINNGENVVSVNLENLPSGSYIYEVIVDSDKFTGKFILDSDN